MRKSITLGDRCAISRRVFSPNFAFNKSYSNLLSIRSFQMILGRKLVGNARFDSIQDNSWHPATLISPIPNPPATNAPALVPDIISNSLCIWNKHEYVLGISGGRKNWKKLTGAFTMLSTCPRIVNITTPRNPPPSRLSILGRARRGSGSLDTSGKERI